MPPSAASLAGTARFPVFKKANDREGGFVIRDVCSAPGSTANGREILIPKAGWVRFRLTYPWAQARAASGARATLRNDTWHISLTTPPSPAEARRHRPQR